MSSAGDFQLRFSAEQLAKLLALLQFCSASRLPEVAREAMKLQAAIRENSCFVTVVDPMTMAETGT